MAVIIYWSGTGNTEAIAERIGADKKIEAISVSNATKEDVINNDVILFGCAAMGDEELEADEFLPFYEDVKKDLVGKKVLLFGSYGWGDGQWLRTWESDALNDGINVVGTLAVNGGESDINEADYLEFINNF